MRVISIKQQQDTPFIHLNKDEGKFEISGKSFPADVQLFYRPIIEWLEEYAKDPNEETLFTFKMDYFNTASTMIILEILYKLEDVIKAGKKVKVEWYYSSDDEDMLDTGEEFQDIVDLDFEIIEYEVDEDDDDFDDE